MIKRPPSENAVAMRRAAIAAAVMAPLLAQRAAAQQSPAPQQTAAAELVLDTMADLKRLTTRPKAVLLSGYRTPTDRGGGLFIWVEGDTTAADDALIVQPDTGAAGRYRRLYDGPVLAAWFGVVGDGVANDTEALQRFLYSVSEGKVADWGGTYAIDEGKLVIEPPPGASSDRGGRLRYYLSPCLLGDVTFIGRGTGTGPFLTVRNPPQRRGGGECMVGGTLGNLTFVDNTKSTLTTRHGLAAQGMYNWTIGSLTGYGLGGSVYSTIVNTVKINGADNPDPYANSLNRFGSVFALDCNAVAYDGDVIGEDGNRISYIGASGEPAPGVTPLENGIMRYTGQGTEVHACSSDGTRGWAMKFGGRQSGNRHFTYSAEIGSENGLWVAALEQFEIKGRVLFTVFHGEAWPRTMLKIGGVGRSVFNGRITLLVKISPGITLPMLGTLIDFSNDPNIGDLEIQLVFHDEGRTGLLNRHGLAGGLESIAKNLHPVAGVTLKVGGTAVLSQYRSTAVRVRLLPGTGPLPSSKFGTLESRLPGNWTSYGGEDGLGIMDAEQHRLLVRATGRYRVHCQLCLPVGTSVGKITPQSLVRYGLVVDDGRGGNIDGLFEGACLVQDAGGVHLLTMDVAAVPLRAGQSVWISLEAHGQNGQCMLSGVRFPNAANILELSLLPPD
jgi:hypothetical protein